MAEDITLQLRILSGTHAGASVPLHGDLYTLGAQGDCDLVLTDEGVQPLHARLSRTEAGWQLEWVAADDGVPMAAPMPLVTGKAVQLGPVILGVDWPDAPWPTLEQLVLTPQLPVQEVAAEPPVAQELDLQLSGWRGWLQARLAHRVMAPAGAVALGASVVAMVAWPVAMSGSLQDPVSAAPAVAVATSLPDEGQKKAIEAVLANLHLGARARLEPAGVGWLVRVAVVSAAEGESLTAALSRLQPPPALRMTTDQDLRDEVADMLLRLAPEYRGAIALSYLGQARFRLQGRMASAAERDKLLRTLAETFPHVREWDNEVMAGDELPQRLLSELRSRGDWDIDAGWEQTTLVMNVKLRQQALRDWERTLLEVSPPHGVVFRARLEFLPPPAPAPAPASTPFVNASLPFELRGVVGGDMPFAVLSNGDKLALGGSWQGWRLAEISAVQVVFESDGRRAIVQR